MPKAAEKPVEAEKPDATLVSDFRSNDQGGVKFRIVGKSKVDCVVKVWRQGHYEDWPKESIPKDVKAEIDRMFSPAVEVVAE